MLSATDSIVDLKLPNHIGVVEGIPQTEENVSNLLREAIAFRTGIEMLSQAQFNDPIIAGQIHTKMTELGGMVNLPIPDLREAISTEGRSIISQEGVMDIFKTVIQTILKWIKNAIAWAKEQWKGFSVTATAMKAASQTTKRTVEKAIATTELDKDAIITATCPSRLLPVFHTAKHMPQVGFRYNYDNLQVSAKNISKYYDVFVDAMLDEIQATSYGLDVITTYMQKDQPIPVGEIYKINQHRKLQGLAHNKFSMIGFRVATRPANADTTIRKDKIVIENEARDAGWYNEGTFTLQYSLNEIRSFCDDNVSHIDNMLSKTGKLYNQMTFKNIERRLSTLEVLVKNTLDGSQMDPAHQTNTLRRLHVVQEMVSQLQLNIRTVDLFTKNYTRLLLGVSNAAFSNIQQSEATK